MMRSLLDDWNEDRSLLGRLPYQQALGVQLIGPDQFGPVISDAYSSHADTGAEQPVPVFSDKERRQRIAWEAMNRAWEIAAQPGGGDPAILQYARRAEQAYNDSLTDPNTPYNLMTARLNAADKQAPADAEVIMDAIQKRRAQSGAGR